MLYTKSIREAGLPSYGIRIMTTSRLTKDDGVTAEKRWIEGRDFEYWAKVLAPPAPLVGWWYDDKRPKDEKWPEFAEKYNLYLNEDSVVKEIKMWASRARYDDITLLCVESTEEFCHRSLLAEKFKSLVEGLEVRHLRP